MTVGIVKTVTRKFMKRSEMIWELATELILFDTGINYDKAQEIAEHLLYRAEKAGMLPPTKPHKIPHAYSRFVKHCKWENEDE